MEIKDTSGSAAYLTLLQQLHDRGEEVSPRGEPTWELRDVTLRITDPTQVHVLGTARRPNVRIAAVEAIQLLAGISNLGQLNAVSAGRFSAYADGGRLLGAYGPRLHGQLDHVVALLQRDPATRQAVATLWRGDEHAAPSRDVPCTTTLQFLQRGGRLELRVAMRSNDAWLGVPYDLLAFGFLQRSVAQVLGVPPGAYTHTVGSMHLYQRDGELARVVVAGHPGRVPPAVLTGGLPTLPGASLAAARRLALSIALRPTAALALRHARGSDLDWWLTQVPPAGPASRLCPECRYVYAEADPHPCPVVPGRVTVAATDLLAEYRRARAKHGAYTLDGGEIDDRQRLAALVEEVGEAAAELTYDHADLAADARLRRELIQVANVALTWASLLPREDTPDAEPAAPRGAEPAASGSPLEPGDPHFETAADLAN